MGRCKTPRACPKCNKIILDLSGHITRIHKIQGRERTILLKVASNRVNTRSEPCPIEECTYRGKRLDRHLESTHRDVSKTLKKRLMQDLKLKTAKAELAKLLVDSGTAARELDQEELSTSTGSLSQAELIQKVEYLEKICQRRKRIISKLKKAVKKHQEENAGLKNLVAQLQQSPSYASTPSPLYIPSLSTVSTPSGGNLASIYEYIFHLPMPISPLRRASQSKLLGPRK